VRGLAHQLSYALPLQHGDGPALINYAPSSPAMAAPIGIDHTRVVDAYLSFEHPLR
jgi:hypothetical protein